MEFLAIIVAALLGWKNATLGRRELKALVIVVVGWTAVTTAAAIPYVSLERTLLALMIRTLVIAVPYVVAALITRSRSRVRKR